MSDIRIRVEHTQIIQHITGGLSPLDEVVLYGEAIDFDKLVSFLVGDE
jgi:hypothetical protein